MPELLFSCPHCDIEMEAEAEDVGLVLDCPGCSEEIEVPAPRKRKKKSRKVVVNSGKRKMRRRSQSRQPAAPADGDDYDDPDDVPGNMDQVKDKVAAKVKMVVGRRETTHSLVSGWVGPHGIAGLLAGKFGKLFRKYYYLVATDQGVRMLRRTGFLGGDISENQLIPYNQIINITYKKGFWDSWVIIRTAAFEKRFCEAEEDLIEGFAATAAAYGASVTAR